MFNLFVNPPVTAYAVPPSPTQGGQGIVAYFTDFSF